MTHRFLQSALRARRRRRASGGQALVEFALVLPILVFMILAIIEFAFVFSALLGVSYATREAALIAAEAGNAANADCAILDAIDKSITAPADGDKIDSVEIYLTNTNGRYDGSTARNQYVRGGVITCLRGDGTTFTVPYTKTLSGYEPTTRCNAIGGCGVGRTLDIIGVRISYTHTWVTPLRGLGGLSGASTTIIQSNAMRMEPVL